MDCLIFTLILTKEKVKQEGILGIPTYCPYRLQIQNLTCKNCIDVFKSLITFSGTEKAPSTKLYLATLFSLPCGNLSESKHPLTSFQHQSERRATLQHLRAHGILEAKQWAKCFHWVCWESMTDFIRDHYGCKWKKKKKRPACLQFCGSRLSAEGFCKISAVFFL